MKSIRKTNISFNFYHLPTSTVLDRKANTTNQARSQEFLRAGEVSANKGTNF